MPTNVTGYNIPVPDGTDPVNLAGTSGDLAAMATAVGTALDGRLPLNSVLYFPAMRSGNYYGLPPGTQTTSAGTDGRAIYYAIIVPNAVTVDRIGAEVQTAAASTTVRLGIYANSATDGPGTLVLDAGTIDSSTTGFKEITVSQALSPGIYWLAAAPVGGTPTLRATNFSAAPWRSPGVSTAASGGANIQTFPRSDNGAVVSSLPNPANINASTINVAFVVQIRVA